jgi:DNA-binding transcriptional LysR family regulator
MPIGDRHGNAQSDQFLGAAVGTTTLQRRSDAERSGREITFAIEQVEPRGTITLTAPVRFGEMHVAPSVTRFLEQHRRVQVNLLLLDWVVNLLD